MIEWCKFYSDRECIFDCEYCLFCPYYDEVTSEGQELELPWKEMPSEVQSRGF